MFISTISSFIFNWNVYPRMKTNLYRYVPWFDHSDFVKHVMPTDTNMYLVRWITALIWISKSLFWVNMDISMYVPIRDLVKNFNLRVPLRAVGFSYVRVYLLSKQSHFDSKGAISKQHSCRCSVGFFSFSFSFWCLLVDKSKANILPELRLPPKHM